MYFQDKSTSFLALFMVSKVEFFKSYICFVISKFC